MGPVRPAILELNGSSRRRLVDVSDAAQETEPLHLPAIRVRRRPAGRVLGRWDVRRAVATDTPGDIGAPAAMMADVERVEVVVAHDERATLRVGDVFVKIDADQTRIDREVAAMAIVPVPTPDILWRKPPALALAALPGTALGHLGEPSTASSAAWAAAGAAARTLHEAPLPPWPGRSLDELASRLAGECDWLIAKNALPADVITRNRRLAEAALRPWTPAFIHGDLQVDHVFVDGDEVTGVVDWSEASPGDALFDLAILTLGHAEHLGDVVIGYGTDVDCDLIRAGGRGDASWRSAGWPSTASAHSRRCPRSPC